MEDPEKEIERSWAANAEAWAEVIRNDGIESRRLATNRAILDILLEREPGRVLDVGCGEGWLTHRLAERGVDVLGFDSSSELVERAMSGPGTFRVLSYASFAADPHQLGDDYDIAVCNFSLLGKEIRPVLRGCSRVLREGGSVVIQTAHPFIMTAEEAYEDGWRREDFRGMGGGFRATMPWYFRTMSTWVAELVESGLALSAVREPIHPVSGRPVSLILVATRSRRPPAIRS